MGQISGKFIGFVVFCVLVFVVFWKYSEPITTSVKTGFNMAKYLPYVIPIIVLACWIYGSRSSDTQQLLEITKTSYD